jgi:hypothetical protein
MDRTEYVQKRKGKYMAQVLESFEEELEPHLEDYPGAVQDFKGLVRARMNALAKDAVEIMSLREGDAQNGLGLELRHTTLS